VPPLLPAVPDGVAHPGCPQLTRKTLGGLQTDLASRVISAETGEVFPGLYAAGEVAGFGGGGVHGYNSLEGTFLTGCIFSGRAAGLALVGNEQPTQL
jgi:predicted oxidoreductase